MGTLRQFRVPQDTDLEPGMYDQRANGEYVKRSGRFKPGSVPIGIATGLLVLLSAGLLIVSVAAQYQYLLAARHNERIPAGIEAGALDAMMMTFSLLAYGLSRAGKPARIERLLILACAGASAGMNFGAANLGSPRSVAAYIVAPIALAVTIDRLIAVVYRYVRTAAPKSAWATVGKAAVTVVLFTVRFSVSPWPTVRGVRRMVLIATPLPTKAQVLEVTQTEDLPAVEAAPAQPVIAAEPEPEPEASPAPELPPVAAVLPIPVHPRRGTRKRHGENKYQHFARLYAAHPDAGDPSKAARIAAELAPKVGLTSVGTARSYAQKCLREAGVAHPEGEELS